MKALIPSGGAGTRLRPITHTSAKQLVPVANKPILYYVLEDIAETGVRQVGIVVGDTGDEIRAAVGDGSAWGLEVSYIQQDAPRGLAHTVLIARDFLGDEPFVMYLGDNMLRDGIGAFVRRFEETACAAQIMVTPVDDPQQYGVVELDGDRVLRLVEKPANPKSNLALVGVYLFDRLIHDAVRALRPSARGELEITEAIQLLVEQGHNVSVHRVEGWWKDTGQPEDLLEANRLVLEGMESRIEGDVDASSKVSGTIVLEKGARVENSRLRGPLIVGRNTTIKDSFLGPFTAIGPDCTIVDSEIEHCVILEECTVRGVHRLEDSLLGRGVVVERTEGRPKSYQLVVGDSGRVGII
ncbi:MAG: glucose-1-phosphate thymidylyltransferase [Actinomycetota bacterium]